MLCCDRVSHFTMTLGTKKSLNYDFSLLPAHIIAQIFVHLDKKSFTSACLVCHNWLYASYDPLVTRTIQICISAKKLDQIDSYKNRKIRPFNRVKIRSCNFKESSNFLEFFKSFGSQIYELELNSCAISNDQLLQIVWHAKNLLILRLINIYQFKADVRFKPCAHMRTDINRTLNNIKVFEVQSNRSTDVTAIGRDLLVNVNNIKVLKFSINSVFESGLFDFRRLVDVMNGWETGKLRELHLDGDFRNANFTNEFYRTISQLKPTTSLQRLRIGKFSRRTWSDQFRCYWDGAFTAFCEKFSKLEELSIDGINMRELKELFEHMVHLKTLRIRNGDIDQFAGIEKLKLLEELSISDPVNGWHPKIDELFINNLPNLKILHVLEFNIDKSSLDLICQNFKNLIDLRIQCLTTDDCECIFLSLVNLTTLHLYFDCTVNRKCNVSKVAKLQEIWISGDRAKIIDSRIFITSMFQCCH